MIPIYLKINNFISHNDSEIDFTKFNVALILGSFSNDLDRSNGSGKSSILESILWVLFGKSRHKKKDGIVKKDKKSCKVKFIFEVENNKYRIVRVRDKVISETDVVLEVDNNGQWKNISCDTNTLTDDKICGIINLNYEVFLNSVYFKQNDISLFAEAKPNERKDILKALLKMDKWDIFQRSAKDKAKILLSKIEDKTNNLVSIDTIEDNIYKCENEIKDIQNKLLKCNNEFTIINNDVMNKKLKYETVSIESQNAPEILKKTIREYNDTKSKTGNINIKINENYDIIKTNQNIISNIQQKIKSLNDKIKLKQNINLPELQNKIVNGKIKEKMMKEHMLHLEKDIVAEQKCPTCRKVVSKYEIKNLKEYRQKELNNLKLRHIELRNKLLKAEQKTKELESISNEAVKSELEKSKIETKMMKCQSDLDSSIQDNTYLHQELKNLQNRNFEKEIQELRIKLDKNEIIKLEKEIEDMSEKIKNLKNECDCLNILYGNQTGNLDKYTKQINEQKIIQKEIDKLKNDYSIYDKLKQYFGKDGIQAIILENVIEELETYANDTLSKICNEPTTITIKTQKQSDSGSWMETFDIEVTSNNRTDDFETFSGGEQFRISFALRLALSKILSQRIGGNIKFLLLDEVSSSLDNKGLEMFINIVKQLGNDMKVLVITHDEKLKNSFSDIIMVNKTNEGSKIVYSSY